MGYGNIIRKGQRTLLTNKNNNKNNNNVSIPSGAHERLELGYFPIRLIPLASRLDRYQ